MPDYLLHSKIVCPEYGKAYPTIRYGKGVYLYDHTGKEYLDAAGGKAAVANIGHGRADIAEVFRRQVEKLVISPTHYFRSDELDAYLAMLIDFAPRGFAKAWTVSSGTEAVENALKAAIQYHHLRGEPGRYKVLGRRGSYHGNSIFTLDVGGMEARREGFRPLLHDFVHAPPAYCYRCPFHLSPDSCGLACANALETCIEAEGPGTVAAFIVEPVVGAALGAVPAPAGYLRRIREICSRYGILLVADEVMTGFGRTGYPLGVDYWEVVPDIIALGKGMASGYYPLSGILLHEKVAVAFEEARQPFWGGHTYSCNPLGAAVGAYVLNCLRDENLVAHSRDMGALLAAELERLRKYPVVGDVRGMGLLAGVELVQDPRTRTPFPPAARAAFRLGEIALRNGLIVYPGGGGAGGGTGDHLLLTPPLVIRAPEVRRLVDLLELSIQAFLEACPLPAAHRP